MYLIGVATFFVCVAILLVGRRIERTLEVLNWVLIGVILTSFLALGLAFVPSGTWLAAGVGFGGYDRVSSAFAFMPGGMDFVLLASLVAYSGCGGITNVTLSNWARDRGYGMGERVGYIPAAVGGQRVHLAHTGFIFTPDAANMTRWHGWWRVVRADQWGVFFMGGLLGMALPALLYVTFLPRGTDIRGLGIAAALASSIGQQAGAAMGTVIALLGAWLLFKTQLDNLEGMVRALTDMLWTGSSRMRAWRGGDVRRVYYSVLGCRRGLGLDCAQARPTDHAAADRRECRRDRLHPHVPARAVHQHEAPAAGAPPAHVAPGAPGVHVGLLRVLLVLVDLDADLVTRSFTTKITKRTKDARRTHSETRVSRLAEGDCLRYACGLRLVRTIRRVKEILSSSLGRSHRKIPRVPSCPSSSSRASCPSC